MTSPTPLAPLVQQLTSGAFRSLLGIRLGSRGERALVLFGEDGSAWLEHPGGHDDHGYPRPRLGQAMTGDFASAYFVHLTERWGWVDVPARSDTMPRPASRQEVAWRPVDPVTIARLRLTVEEVFTWITNDAANRGFDPDQTYEIPGIGISYRALRQVAMPSSDPAPGAGAVMPSSWSQAEHDSFRFYRDLTTGGDPTGLLALWLLHHPQQARDVLEWTVTHHDLLTGRDQDHDRRSEDTWEHSLVSLLRDLGPADRSFLGVQMATVLHDLGVPHAEDALDRVRRDTGDPSANGAADG